MDFRSQVVDTEKNFKNVKSLPLYIAFTKDKGWQLALRWG